MKITVKNTIEREIEITFPCSFKTKDSVTFYHFYSERIGVSLWPTIGHINSLGINSANFNDLIPCDKSEVEAVFKSFVRNTNEIINPIVIDLYSNTTTEELENLNTILFGHDKG